MKKSTLYVVFLIVFGGILFFYNLGGWDLWNPDEPRYAQIAKEMLQGEGWIIPHLNSEVYLDKPPLFFWLMAATATALGGMTEFAARFPSAFFGLFTLLLLFYLGKRLFNEKVGFLSALILATSVEYLWLAHRANIDATLTFFTTAAITCFYVGFYKRQGKWILYLFAYGAMAFGVLAKLQIGVIVPVLVIGGYFLMQREWRFFKDPSHIPGIALFVAFIGGWLALAYLSGGKEYLWGLLYQKTAATFFETASHARPFYYYLVNFPYNFVPWIVFFPSALIFGLSAKGRKKEFIFAFFWFVVIFAFFSISEAKRDLYLLPLYPAAALMVGYLLEQLPLGAEGVRRKIISIPFLILVITLALGAISLPIVAAIKGKFYLQHPWEIGIISALIVGGGGFLAFHAYQHRRRDLPFYIIVVTVFALTLYGLTRIVPEVDRYKSARPLSQAIVSAMRPGDQLGVYQMEGASFNYYTGYNQIKWLEEEKDLRQFLRSPQRVLCIMRDRHYNLLQKDPTLSISVVATGQVGHKRLAVISNRQTP
ncbi:MAG: glycosyltransferase family 39 protein [Deltaproteobacteria bacterium]|nr:glycosyltransferase family 39 protein [Deltaproteobacteria bacterium]